MKKLSAFILTTIGIFSTMIINAQWQNKASGFPTPRNFVELIAVDDKVAKNANATSIEVVKR